MKPEDQATCEGWTAHREGRCFVDNPYQEGTPLWRYWATGWLHRNRIAPRA